MVCDTLQRHTLSLDNPVEGCYFEALEKGTEWLNRNQKVINAMPIKSKIIRWDFWLAHRDYCYYKQCVQEKLKKDKEYLNSFTQSSKLFISRYKKRKPETIIENEVLFDKCMAYLVEECAVFPIWLKEGWLVN